MSLQPENSSGDEALVRILEIDGLLSVIGSVASLYAFGGHTPVVELWVGFLIVNIAVWSAVALGGTYRLARDLVAALAAGRQQESDVLHAAVSTDPAQDLPSVADLLEEGGVPTFHVALGDPLNADAREEPELVGAAAE